MQQKYYHRFILLCSNFIDFNFVTAHYSYYFSDGSFFQGQIASPSDDWLWFNF